MRQPPLLKPKVSPIYVRMSEKFELPPDIWTNLEEAESVVLTRLREVAPCTDGMAQVLYMIFPDTNKKYVYMYFSKGVQIRPNGGDDFVIEITRSAALDFNDGQVGLPYFFTHPRVWRETIVGRCKNMPL